MPLEHPCRYATWPPLPLSHFVIPATVCAKTFRQTSPNSILEEFFLFDEVNFMQFLLDIVIDF
jgi:hypothetical protein